MSPTFCETGEVLDEQAPVRTTTAVGIKRERMGTTDTSKFATSAERANSRIMLHLALAGNHQLIHDAAILPT